MLPENPKLIIITSEKNISGEAAIINDLFEAGLPLLHIRKPTYTIEETRNLVNSISTDFHSRIVVHNHYELLNEFNLEGAHLPEKLRKESDLTLLKNIISSSFHTLEDIIIEKMNFEYVFFSPVFQSISKQGYEPSIELKKITDFFNSKKNEIRFPVIALGGITDKNILQASDMGFNGAACIGYIWESSKPLEQFNKLQKILQG